MGWVHRLTGLHSSQRYFLFWLGELEIPVVLMFWTSVNIYLYMSISSSIPFPCIWGRYVGYYTLKLMALERNCMNKVFTAGFVDFKPIWHGFAPLPWSALAFLKHWRNYSNTSGVSLWGLLNAGQVLASVVIERYLAALSGDVSIHICIYVFTEDFVRV